MRLDSPAAGPISRGTRCWQCYPTCYSVSWLSWVSCPPGQSTSTSSSTDKSSYCWPLSRLVCFGYQSRQLCIRGDGAIIKLPCTNYPNKSEPRDFNSSTPRSINPHNPQELATYQGNPVNPGNKWE